MRYWCEGKVLGVFARGVSGLRRSGILLLLLRPRKEGWLGWERESEGGQDRRGMLVLGRGGDVEWMHSNASIIDKGQSDYDCSVSLVLLRKPSDDTRPNSRRVAERGRSGSLLLLDPTQVLCKALLLASFHIPHPSTLTHAAPPSSGANIGRKVICHTSDSKFPLISFRAQPQLQACEAAEE
jgi:hypothetical protein